MTLAKVSKEEIINRAEKVLQSIKEARLKEDEKTLQEEITLIEKQELFLKKISLGFYSPMSKEQMRDWADRSLRADMWNFFYPCRYYGRQENEIKSLIRLVKACSDEYIYLSPGDAENLNL